MKYSAERQEEREGTVPALILVYCCDVIIKQPRDSPELRLKPSDGIRHKLKCVFLLFPFTDILMCDIYSCCGSVRKCDGH